MSNNHLDPHKCGMSSHAAATSRFIDPDPFSIASVILATVSTAAGIYSALQARTANDGATRTRASARRAAVLRWEAHLVELKEQLAELQDFLADHDIPATTRLSPLTEGMLFGESELRVYRRLIGKLIGKAKLLSDSTVDLLPMLDDQRTLDFLSESVEEVRRRLSDLHAFNSMNSVFAEAAATVALLLRTAEYLREGLIT